MDFWTLSEKNIWVAAHRGWSSAYPENTMEAFRAALALDVDQIETDVRITKDGELVLIHDATVDRTTNGTGRVDEMTLAELQSLCADNQKGEPFQNCRIPLFTDLLELVKEHPTITLDIELKEYPTEGHEEVAYSVCDRVLALLEKYGFTDRCVINTFSGKLHEYIQGKYGKRYKHHVYFPVEKNGAVTVDPYSYAYCCCMFSQEKGKRMATAEEYDEMRSKGVQPWAGAGVRDEEGVDEAIAKGACLITCNNPDRIVEILRAKGYHK